MSLAAIFHHPDQPLELCQLSLPEHLLPGEAVVRVNCCTLCGSDLSTLAGHRQEPTPCILGHEIVGTIETLGPRPLVDLRGRPVQIGDRVVWSVAATCDICRNCRRGLPQKCEHLRKYGHTQLSSRWQLSGGLAEHCHLVCGTKLVVVDQTLADEVLAPASCATATIACAVRTAGNVSGARVLIFGAGLLGLTACAMAKSLGADSVTVCDVALDRLQLAQRFGADEVIAWSELAQAPDRSFDTVFELSGNASAVAAALSTAAVGAAVVLVGSVRPTPPVELHPEKIVRRVISVHGVHNYAPRDLVAAVEFLEQSASPLPFAEIVSIRAPLDQIQSVLRSTASAIRIAIQP